jgi:hypothetical protein
MWQSKREISRECNDNLELNIFLLSALEQLSVFQRLTLHLRGDDHDDIVTHGWSREFRMHIKNPERLENQAYVKKALIYLLISKQIISL